MIANRKTRKLIIIIKVKQMLTNQSIKFPRRVKVNFLQEDCFQKISLLQKIEEISINVFKF